MIASRGLLPAFRIGSLEPPWSHFNPIHPELCVVWLWLFVGAAAAAQHDSRLGKLACLISNNIKGCGTGDLRRIQHLLPRISGSRLLCTNRSYSGLFSEAMPLKDRRAQKSLFRFLSRSLSMIDSPRGFCT